MKKLSAALLFTLLTTGCGTLSSYNVDPDDSQTLRYVASHDLQFEVDSLATPLIENKVTPGLVVGILLPDGDPQFYSYGVADKITQARMNPDTVFHVGSISKVFLGLIAAKLVDDGVLSWDTTLAKALPDVTLSDDAKTITLEQLATNTSGLPRQPYRFKTMLYFTEYLFTGNNFYRNYDMQYIFNYLEKFRAPKEKAEYSNIGYGLLGYIIEKITEKSLDSLLGEIILQSLYLTRTGYRLEEMPDITNKASGYAGDQPKFIRRGQPVPDWSMTEAMKGSASMYSSARDLLTLAKAYIDEPLNLKTAINDTLYVRLPRPREAYAIAWTADSFNGYEIYYMTGVIAGYTSFIGINKKHSHAVVVLQNSFNWSANIGYQLLVRLADAREIEENGVSASFDAE
ncbi:MAG: beta-lactamase family protein [Desulfovibrionaceae bacterium]|nr:beta-lactamase family protein [Desulfovibrionaceae bacterium]